MFKDRVEKGIFESSHDSYRNPWFLVKKKKKNKYRLVNVVMEINRVIIKNTNLPPSINEFFKKFARCVIAFLIDFFSSYNQIELNKKNKDLTTFYTFIGLLRITIFF